MNCSAESHVINDTLLELSKLWRDLLLILFVRNEMTMIRKIVGDLTQMGFANQVLLVFTTLHWKLKGNCILCTFNLELCADVCEGSDLAG